MGGEQRSEVNGAHQDIHGRGAQADRGPDPLETAPPGRAFEEAAEAYHDGLGSPGAEGPAYAPTDDGPVSGGASGGAGALIQTLEVPLKAANRLLAGVPVIGRPLSEAGRLLWEQLRVASGQRRP